MSRGRLGTSRLRWRGTILLLLFGISIGITVDASADPDGPIYYRWYKRYTGSKRGKIEHVLNADHTISWEGSSTKFEKCVRGTFYAYKCDYNTGQWEQISYTRMMSEYHSLTSLNSIYPPQTFNSSWDERPDPNSCFDPCPERRQSLIETCGADNYRLNDKCDGCCLDEIGPNGKCLDPGANQGKPPC